MNMRMLGVVTFVGVLAVSALGCATSFTGSAFVENGRNGCDAKCRGQGMQVAGMVYMGEYSDACICEVPRATGSSGVRDERRLLALTGGSMGGAAGVIMQMQRQQQQQMQQQQMMMMH
jgi:hypothetical protein